jgi:predicted nucleic acid-binding Zn ribbon protein
MARERREPRSIGDVVGAVGRDLGTDDPRRIARIATDWDEVLGPELAPHVRFVSLRDGVLVLGATDPAWASRARFEGPRIAAELDERQGAGTVRDVRVRVLREDPRAR